MKNVEFISNELRLDGNHLCFDFVNTIFDRHAEEIRDLLGSAEDWTAWLKKTGLLKPDVQLNKNVEFNLEEVVQTRDMLHRVFSSIQSKNDVLKKDLRLFEKWVIKVQRHTRLSVEKDKPTQEVVIDNANLNNYLLLVVKAAYELFLSVDTNRIKDCSHCGWLYLDTSKNNSRKWCSMDTCGSQLKARRYYRSKKERTIHGDD